MHIMFDSCQQNKLIKKEIAVFIRTSLLLLLFLFFVSRTLAGGDGGIQKTTGKRLSGGTLINGASAFMEYLPEQNEVTADVQIINNVSLSINEAVAGLSSFNASVTVKIEYGDNAGSLTTLPNQVLKVTYNPATGIKYNAQNRIMLKGIKYLRVTVMTAPSVTGPTGTKAKLTLANEMTVTRYYDLANNNVPAPNFLGNPTATNGELPVVGAVSSNPGNNATQFEWTWLDDAMASVYTTNGTVNTDLLFRNNATRVDVPAGVTQYNIPLIYQGPGKLYYRARFVTIKKNGSRSDGPWSVVRSYSYSGHENSMNWQVTTSFAEEGKRKTVIQYYDGSLRARQTVTKNNTDNTVVAAETIYDVQGRPAIQVLPSPEISNTIDYLKNLNLFNGQAINTDPTQYFDLKSTPVPTAMQTVSGAAKYYSPSNSNVTDNTIKKVPDAEGFPFSLTRYTPDGSGRILSQSSVGKTLQASTTTGMGHDTKYFYGTPSQEELDGLFGTEVGNYTHYFKNMVLDANRQTSVSYVDMHGRTIATALAGDAPLGMQSLLADASSYPNQQAQLISRNLLTTNSNIMKGNSLESITTLLVPVSKPYEFTYVLTPPALSITGCDNNTYCFDAQYDLEISITDESGDNSPITRKFSNITLNPDNTCSTAPALLQTVDGNNATITGNTISFSIPLDPGSYTVRKTLSINRTAFLRQRDIWLTKALCKTEQDIIDSVYMIQKGITGCSLDHSNTVNDCPGTLCTTTISHTLEGIKQQMLADMVPYSGQYAKDPATMTSTDPNQINLFNKYNIFSTTVSSNIQPYQYPWDNYSNPVFYKDNFGVKDPTLYPLGTEINPVLPASVTPAIFAGTFSRTWAEQLLPHHPEFAKYQYASTTLANCYDWIDKFSNTTSYNDAVTANYIFTPNSSTASPYNDPYYLIQSLNSPDKSTMEKWVDPNKAPNTSYKNSTLTFWQIASGNVRCKNIEDATELSNCYGDNVVPGTALFNGLSDADKDAIWENFKNLYANERNNLINVFISVQKPLPVNEDVALKNAGYLLHFPKDRQQTADVLGWTGFPAVAGDAPAIPANQDDMGDVYKDRCSAYIDLWKQKLLQCSALANHPQKDAILNAITTRMQAVCQYGSDEANPFGSSTVAPATPASVTDRSFEDVIVSVFKAYSIINTNGVYTDGFCNPFVIDYPKPYGKGGTIIPAMIGVIQPCNCTLFRQLQASAITAGYNPYEWSSLNQYLSNTGQENITQPLFDALSNCSSLSGGGSSRSASASSVPLYTNTTLSSPQPLPRYLQCGYSGESGCHSCAELSSLTAEYKAKFATPYQSAPTLSAGTLTTQQVASNVVWERFMNYRTGLRAGWREYVVNALTKGCNLAQTNTDNTSILCDSTSKRPLTDTTGMFVKASPCAHTYAISIDIAQNLYKARKEQLLADFTAAYTDKCLPSPSGEQFTVKYQNSEYHYTLYFYDQAGNLVKTVPPKGVRPDFSQTFTDAVKAARQAGTTKLITHLLTTNYRYNSLNQVISQNTPDGGTGNFWYDYLGRLVVSQNAKQAATGKWSYTIYDPLGRINEVGQKPQTTAMTQATSQSQSALITWLGAGSVKEQVTYTTYDAPYLGIPDGLDTYIRWQQNLRNRVSYTEVKNLATDQYHYAATYYTYDVHGNVDTLLQDFKGIAAMDGTGNRFKRLTYDYDLISGKVDAVDYQPALLNTVTGKYEDQTDAFYHQYYYDAENRLTEVETSRDKLTWETDATYAYYKHGPLSRTELGALQVQGLDFTYTLQGWLKGINGSADGDGATGSLIAKDAYSYQLNYYTGDYKGIDVTNPSSGLLQQLGSAFKPLYNGNIAAMGVSISSLNSPMVYNYGYDQLNRLRQMDAYQSTTNAWTSLTATQDYKENITYDPNGNIQTYLRNGTTAGGLPQAMDNMTYTYQSGNNKLSSIADAVAATNYANDIDGQAANNYSYDEIGNLTGDVKEGITNVTWNVYGKILSITKSGTTITYGYDASGNRITKQVGNKVTTYVRDAQGNVLAVYDKVGTAALHKTETHLYGSSRLGIIEEETVAPATLTLTSTYGPAWVRTFTRGEKAYELSNHLGNVLVTISDKRIGHDAGNGTIDYYTADVKSASDYYPFGMQMPGRMANPSNYRYGFNGKENDNEVKGDGNQQDYGMRIYDPRVGRFLSVDPLSKSYPWYSPYQFAGNSPIKFIDLDGLEPSENPKSPGVNEVRAMTTVAAIERVADGKDALDNFFSRSGIFSEDIKGTYSCSPDKSYRTDTDGDPENKFNMKVSNSTIFNVDESQASHTDNYEAFIVSRLLNNFVIGEGPENYNFSTNGIISSKFLSSDIFQAALSKYKGEVKNGKTGTVIDQQFNFKGPELKKDFLRNETLFSITGLTGSAKVTMVQTQEGVKVEIFNITSLYSGDASKDVFGATPSKSYVRDPDKNTTYGNISETYNLLIPYNDPLLK